MLKAQTNLSVAIEKVEEWGSVPMYGRKFNLPENLMAVDEIAERNHSRYHDVENSYRELEAVLKENYRLYFNLPPEPEPGEGEEEVRLQLLVSGRAGTK